MKWNSEYLKKIEFLMLQVVLKVHGKAAHSGYPHLGESAIDKLLDILQEIRSHKWPADESLGIGQYSYLT